MKPQKKKVVIFDFDGTLVDSMEAFADLAASIMPRYYPLDAATARRRYLETSGLPFREQLEVICPRHPSNDAAAEAFEREKETQYLTQSVYDDAIETLRALRSRKIRIAISSNNFQNLVERFVAHAGLECDLVLGWRPNFSKGERHFLHIESLLKVKRQDMAFVGDSLHDADRAKKAGIDFIGKTGTFTSTQFQRAFPQTTLVQHLSELKRIL